MPGQHSRGSSCAHFRETWTESRPHGHVFPPKKCLAPSHESGAPPPQKFDRTHHKDYYQDFGQLHALNQRGSRYIRDISVTASNLCSMQPDLSASISREHSSATSARSRRDSFSAAVLADTRSAARLFPACRTKTPGVGTKTLPRQYTTSNGSNDFACLVACTHYTL